MWRGKSYGETYSRLDWQSGESQSVWPFSSLHFALWHSTVYRVRAERVIRMWDFSTVISSSRLNNIVQRISAGSEDYMNTIAPATSINYLSHLVDVFVSVLFLLLFLLFGTPLDSAFLDAPVCFCVYAHSSNGESLELFFFLSLSLLSFLLPFSLLTYWFLHPCWLSQPSFSSDRVYTKRKASEDSIRRDWNKHERVRVTKRNGKQIRWRRNFFFGDSNPIFLLFVINQIWKKKLRIAAEILAIAMNNRSHYSVPIDKR